MNPGPTVADFMATELLTFAPEQEINRAMAALLERRFSGAPVVDATGRLLGVLSKKDCMRAAFNAAYHRSWGGSVADYMSPQVQTLDASMPVLDAATLLTSSPYRRFPVLSAGRLVGQISRADIMRALLTDWQSPAAPDQ